MSITGIRTLNKKAAVSETGRSRDRTLDGTSMIEKVINETFAHPVPFFDDIISPNSGLSGLRLIVHQNDTPARPLHEGIDISTGTAVSIGIVGSKSVHLPEPYSKCNDGKNDEQLFHDIKVGKLPNASEKDWKAYTQGQCRYDINIVILIIKS